MHLKLKLIKMKLKKKISIDEFDGKRSKISLLEQETMNEKKAVITHYLHNMDNGVAKNYQKDALKYINEYVQYQEEENNFSLVAEDALQQLLFEVNDVPFPNPENYKFKFIDLFAGIGGFHIAMSNLGGECVLASEIDKFAIETYFNNFGISSNNDVTKINPEKMEQYDTLCAGFPCQPFSKAGSQLGFADEIKGTLFFEIVS
jgi:DNA (cytosine-5)-methyltransferase 1